MKRRDFLLISLGAALAAPVFAAETARSSAVPISLGAAINKAGRQRMLSQRMAKAFGMQVLGVLPDKAVSQLDVSRLLFETQLAELKTLAPNEGIQAGIGELERSWQSYRTVLAGPRTVDGGRMVMVEADKTLRAAQALTVAYEKYSGSSAGRLLNLSGRQRMLSQRLAKCFMFQQAGGASDALRVEQEAARRDFTAALAELNAARENTEAIKSGLELANTQWLFFDQALTSRESVKDIAARNVATTSERILEVMDDLTAQYEQLVRA